MSFVSYRYHGPCPCPFVEPKNKNIYIYQILFDILCLEKRIRFQSLKTGLAKGRRLLSFYSPVIAKYFKDFYFCGGFSYFSCPISVLECVHNCCCFSPWWSRVTGRVVRGRENTTEKGCARRHVCLREEPGWSHATFHIRQTSTVLIGRGAREPAMRSGAGGLQEELDVAMGEVRLRLEL